MAVGSRFFLNAQIARHYVARLRPAAYHVLALDSEVRTSLTRYRPWVYWTNKQVRSI